MHALRSAALLLLLLLAALHGHAQAVHSNTGAQSTARDAVVALYMDALGQSLPVYQGAEWISVSQKAKGHPYFGGNSPYRGSVRYQGAWYPGLSLQYDIQKGMLLVLPDGDGLKLEMPRNKLDRFVLDSTVFIRPDPAEAMPGLPDSVFYRVVYPGPTTVLAWHRKSILDRPGEENSNVFEEEVQYYARAGNTFREMTGEKQLLSLKGSRNKALRKLLADKGIRFRKDPEKALILGAAFYDQQP